MTAVMSAVAAAAVANGGHEGAKDSGIDHSPSRFTAVNGRDHHPSHLNGISENHLSTSHDPEREISADIRRASDLQQNTSVPREVSVTNMADVVHHAQTESRRNSNARPANVNRNKRKRSDSDRHDSPPASQYANSASRSPISKAEDAIPLQARSVENNLMSRPTMTPDSEVGHQTSHRRYSPTDGTDEANTNFRRPPWDGIDPHSTSHGGQLAQSADPSDAQMVEALQRDVQNDESGPKSWDSVQNGPMSEYSDATQAQVGNLVQNLASAPDKQAIQPNIQPHTKSQNRTQTPPASQSGSKRKRVFSNRTKTGCMTCRRRKKKCDEQHPACKPWLKPASPQKFVWPTADDSIGNNCIRGNFPCEGYSVRSTWQKPSNPKGPVPLQSKGAFPEVPHAYTHEVSPQRHDTRATGSMIPDGSKARPVSVDEADRAAAQYISSPPGAGSRNTWAKSAWGTQGPTTYLPEGPPKPEFRDGSSLKDHSRADPGKADYPAVHSSCDLPHSAHPKPGINVFQPNMEQRPAPPRIDAANYSAQARMALNMESHIVFESTNKSEKEKMITGEPYRPFDPQLVKDRERCKTALWRYTNAGNPIHGISTTERTRLLKEILMPPSEPSAEKVTSNTVGSLGPGAVVEAPFNCHYGYNISIGEDVLVSENCFFADDCAITVGAHTWIGPNVTILSSMAIGSMQERKGSQSRYQGRPVVIAEDCWIGAGCTILPGVTLGRGAYIAPGEVVRSQILPYGFQGLKPNYP